MKSTTTLRATISRHVTSHMLVTRRVKLLCAALELVVFVLKRKWCTVTRNQIKDSTMNNVNFG